MVKGPHKYSFDSHAGFTPVKGSIDQKGSLFKTRERFLGFFVALLFETVDIDPEAFFRFRLVKPLKNAQVHGEFAYRKACAGHFELALNIESTASSFIGILLASIVFYGPLRFLIQKQIKKEAEFIKTALQR